MDVTYTRRGAVQTFELGVPGFETMTVDQTDVAPEARTGLAKRLLAASALSCYGAMLAATLEARDVPVTAVHGKATMVLGPNAAGQGRVKSILLEFTVELPQEYSDLFERCAKIMRNGCLITGSMHEGIAVEHSLRPVYTA